MKKYDIILIGAGVVGAFIARELSKYKLDVLILDKENDVGNVTSMANSAIIHSGYDPKPATLKAKLNVLGNQMFDEIAEQLDVSFARIGSLTIAMNLDDLKTLEELKKRAEDNGVEVELLNKEATLEKEKNLNPNLVGSLFAKTSGIVDTFNLVAHAIENAIDNGVELLLGKEVVDIQYKNSSFFVLTKDGKMYQSAYVINAAGLASDKIARMIGEISWSITPRKGQYFLLDHYSPDLVKSTIFPLPSSKGKGVLISRTTSGNYLVGPSSEFVDSISDLATDKDTLDYVKEMASELIPSIPFNQTIRIFSGLRATSTRGDFIIENDSNNDSFLNIGGIESPGLVSAPAIAKYVVSDFISHKFKLEMKENYNPYVKKYIKAKTLPKEERNKLIKEKPEYGEMVCYCEQVSLGEVMDVLSRNGAPRTIKGLKKRIRAGFGKCQGGFCQNRMVIELAKQYGLSLDEVLYDKEGSNILKGESK